MCPPARSKKSGRAKFNHGVPDLLGALWVVEQGKKLFDERSVHGALICKCFGVERVAMLLLAALFICAAWKDC